MIDIAFGSIAYAVLSFGGGIFHSIKLFAVPWSALTVDEDEKRFILDVVKNTPETLLVSIRTGRTWLNRLWARASEPWLNVEDCDAWRANGEARRS